MLDTTQDDLQREIQVRLQQIPPAEWVRKMIDYYQRTGTYRAQDLRQLLGDPTKGVEVGSNVGVSSLLSKDRG